MFSIFAREADSRIERAPREAPFLRLADHFPREPLLGQLDEKHRRGYEYCVIARLSRNKREPVTMTPRISLSPPFPRLLNNGTTDWDHEFQIFRGDANTEATRTNPGGAARKFTSNYDTRSRLRRFNRPRKSFPMCRW